MTVKIEIEVSENNRATRAPYWMVYNYAYKVDINNFYNHINGPFFSEEEANNHIKNREIAGEDIRTLVVMIPCAPIDSQYAMKLARQGKF